MKLYFSPGACSLSPHIVLREAGLPVELLKVDLAAKTLPDGGDYLRINPKGYVPAVELPNGEVLTEGPAIVQYIADQNSDNRLAPKAGTIERYRLQEWLNFISTEIHKGFSPLFRKDITPEWRTAVIETLSKRFDVLAAKLDGKQFVMGEQFTVADAYLFVVLNWSRGVKLDLSKWPVLAEYHKRIATRPKVQEALKAEGLIK